MRITGLVRPSILCVAFAAAFGSEWPRFRGPNGAGVSSDHRLPTEISRDRNVLWKTQTPKGHSSPIVVQGRVYITGHEGDERILLCHDAASGSLLWRSAVPKARTESPNPMNGPTTPTAATDGRSIFVFFPDVGLLAFDLDGKERWRAPLGPFGAIQGMAVSPIYAEGNVVLLIDTPEEAYLAAFDAKTGKPVWKTERLAGFMGSYSTPALYQASDKPAQIVAAGALELTGYQAKTGERLWWARGVTNAPAAPPLISGDAIYTVEPSGAVGAPPFSQMLNQFDKDKNGKIELTEVSGSGVNDKIMHRLFKSLDKNMGNGDGVLTEDEYTRAFGVDRSDGGLVRTRLTGKGDVTATHVGWRHRKGLPYVTGPLLYNNILYVIRDGGILSTFNPDTGQLLREARLKDALGEYYASPVAGDGKVYFVNKDGKVSVIRAGANWEMLSTGDLDEQVIATPAIAGSRIYIRTEDNLYCFGVKDAG
jgi:outer membrane protein assembly factor BamB